MNLRICLSPHGSLLLETTVGEAGDDEPIRASLSEKNAAGLSSAFTASPADGLLLLAGPSVHEALPADLVFWRDWSRQVLAALSRLDEEQLQAFARSSTAKTAAHLPPPDELALSVLIAAAPPMRGLEYLTPDVLKDLWLELANTIRERGAGTEGGLAAFLRAMNPPLTK